MRISHLQDHEIQAYLDRCRIPVSDEDVEVKEHLENCVRCREEVHTYELLYGELAEEPTVSLPRNFAKKVTLSLPPLAAARTRARVRAWLAGLAAALTLPVVLAALNLKVLLISAAVSLTTGYVAALTWFYSTVSHIPVPDFSSLEALADLTMLNVIEGYFMSDNGTFSLFGLAVLLILIMVSLEGLMPIRTGGRKTS